MTRSEARNGFVLAGATPCFFKAPTMSLMPAGRSGVSPASIMKSRKVRSISMRSLTTDMSGNSRASSSTVGGSR